MSGIGRNGHGALGVTLYSDAAYYGGAEVYLAMLARNLDRERFRLSALVPDDPPVPRLESELSRAGAVIYRHRRPGLAWWKAVPRIRRHFREIGGDILHINLPSTYDAGLSCVALAARMAGYSRVLTTEHLPMIPRRYRRFPMKLLFSEAVDAIIVPAVATREHVVNLHHMPREKTRIIPYGIEPPRKASPGVEEDIRSRTDTPPGVPAIGIVGRLTARKGHRFLFEALRILMQQGRLPSPVRVWVIGEGEDRDTLIESAQDLGLSEIVRFVGPRADAASLMALLDVLAVPSLMETTPFVILEAMAAGIPVVASRIYGIPEMIEDHESGRLVEPGDASDLAAALAPILADPELRTRYGRRGRERFESIFAAERMARATESAYLGLEPEGFDGNGRLAEVPRP